MEITPYTKIIDIFKRSKGLINETVTVSMKGEMDSLEEYKIKVIDNHLAFIAVSTYLNHVPKTSSPNPLKRKSKKDSLQLETETLFLVPIISTLSCDVIDNTIAFKGRYGIPVIKMNEENVIQMDYVLDKLVVTRLTEYSLLEIITTLETRKQCEGPILSIDYIPLFGISLRKVMACQRSIGDLDVPYFFYSAIRYLDTVSMNEEGIFRLSGDNEQMKVIRKEIEMGHEIDWTRFNIHSITNVVKQWFRELPENILNPNDLKMLQTLVDEITDDTELKKQLKEALKSIYKPSADVLSLIGHLVNRISLNAMVNMMNEKNLLICLTPSIKIYGKLLMMIMFHHDEVFDTFPICDYIR